ncbi:MAG: cytochrome c maturation protein CcmE [Methylovirgula sp.]|nr:cytochrome c maturation protein CcmE [Methylovirgula sp.]
MTRKKKRLTLIAAAMGVLGIGLGLILYNFRDNISFSVSPTEIAEKGLGPGSRVRVGGLVKRGTVDRTASRLHFILTDGKRDIAVTYDGPVPDLFREGQGVVAEGVLNAAGLDATEVFAKHDERYMPKEVVDALKKSGRWQENVDMGGAAQ